MKRGLVGIVVAMMAMALVSCGGGSGGGTATGFPSAQLSPSSAAASALAQPGSSKSEVDQAAVQGLVAQQVDQGDGLASVLAQGPAGLELIHERLFEASSVVPGRRRIFAYLPASLKIASIPNPNPAPGQSVATELIFPYSVGVGGYKYGIFASNLAYDARRDRLYVPVNNGGIGILKNASSIKGEVPVRDFYVPTAMDVLGSVFLDIENDTLWLVSSSSSTARYTSIAKITNISDIESKVRVTIGNRAMLPADLVTVWHVHSATFAAGFAVDVKRSLIYMENGNVFDLNLVAPAPLVNDIPGYASYPINEIKAWDVLPARRFFDGTKFLTSVAFDAIRDRLYFVDAIKKQLLVVEHASTATAATVPVALDLPGPVATYSSLTIDAKNDRLYIGGAGNDGYVINNASTINAGLVFPASYVFATSDQAQTRSEVWGVAVPQ